MKSWLVGVAVACALAASSARAAEKDHVCEGRAKGSDDSQVTVWLHFDSNGAPKQRLASWSPPSRQIGTGRTGLLFDYRNPSAESIGSLQNILVTGSLPADPAATQLAYQFEASDGRSWQTTVLVVALRDTEAQGYRGSLLGLLVHSTAVSVQARRNLDLLEALTGIQTATGVVTDPQGHPLAAADFRFSEIGERDHLFAEAWTQAVTLSAAPLSCRTSA